MPHKNLTLKVVDEAAGTVEAVFSTLNVVDKDGDVTLPGAFTGGEKVKISDWNHTSWDGARPVGRGDIRETETEAILTGRFFMDTAAGRDAFTVVKELGELCEWSYGYDILENSFGVFGTDEQKVQFLRKLKVHECSPVILGAGENTRTLSAKAFKGHKLTDHADAVVTAFDELVDRIADVTAMRMKEGKTLGTDTLAVLQKLNEHHTRLRDVLTTAPPDTDSDSDLKQKLTREIARFERMRATL